MIQKRISLFSVLAMTLLVSLVISGCSITFQKGRRSDVEKIQNLLSEVDELNKKLGTLADEKTKEIGELEEAKKLLEERLKQEIGDDQVRLEMADKGLAIVFLAEVLFDSGKADIRQEAMGTLDKIANVLNEEVKSRDIGVEGYTDNDPIKYSGWKSNWELSTGRAVSILHYLVDQKGIEPKRISATGYGEYRPVASNDTQAGRKKNRRVEIVVLPKNIAKIQADMQKIEERKRDIESQLKKYKK